jgi:hypothetical protein
MGNCRKVNMMKTMYNRQWMLAMPIGPTLTAEGQIFVRRKALGSKIYQ